MDIGAAVRQGEALLRVVQNHQNYPHIFRRPRGTSKYQTPAVSRHTQIRSQSLSRWKSQGAILQPNSFPSGAGGGTLFPRCGGGAEGGTTGSTLWPPSFPLSVVYTCYPSGAATTKNMAAGGSLTELTQVSPGRTGPGSQRTPSAKKVSKF